MTGGDADDAQRERALGAWELVVHDVPTPAVLAAIRRALRVKRFELERVAAQLPGVVRRGARVDLEQGEARLREAGVRCELRRREAADSQSRPTRSEAEPSEEPSGEVG